jgi:hypothetical protein
MMVLPEYEDFCNSHRPGLTAASECVTVFVRANCALILLLSLVRAARTAQRELLGQPRLPRRSRACRPAGGHEVSDRAFYDHPVFEGMAQLIGQGVLPGSISMRDARRPLASALTRP